jgi:protein-tyrosine phosphatase
MNKPYERRIPFESVFNFRDLGGYRTRDGRTVRWRRLFRSSEIQRITPNEVEYARNELGVTTVIDLRQPEVAVLEGTGPLAEPPVKYVNISLYEDKVEEDLERLMSNQPPMWEDYVMRLKQPAFGKGIVRALEVMAGQEDGAAVFHCSAGKDRSGKLAAVILGIMGVSDADIVRDYAMTARYIPPQIDYWWKNDPESSPYFHRVPPYMYDSRPETMEYVLEALYSEYGSMRGYVEAHGGSQSLFTRLENTLLE